jgi:hypothetical protein
MLQRFLVLGLLICVLFTWPLGSLEYESLSPYTSTKGLSIVV